MNTTMRMCEYRIRTHACQTYARKFVCTWYDTLQELATESAAGMCKTRGWRERTKANRGGAKSPLGTMHDVMIKRSERCARPGRCIRARVRTFVVAIAGNERCGTLNRPDGIITMYFINIHAFYAGTHGKNGKFEWLLNISFRSTRYIIYVPPWWTRETYLRGENHKTDIPYNSVGYKY